MTTLVLRYADVGVATYASLRVVGAPERTVTWVVEEPWLLAALEELDDALPEPRGGESAAEAVSRARTYGAFSDPDSELALAYHLGALLISMPAWHLLLDCVSDPRADLFVTPSARLGRVPWGQLAVPLVVPDLETLLRASAEAITTEGTGAARIDWLDARKGTFPEGFRLMELADVAMAVPTNIAARHRRQPGPDGERPLLVLDPRVPGQRADGPLGSVLGRPSPDTALSRHYAGVLARQPVLPVVADPVELFRRTDADRHWLAELLAQRPSRMVFVGHVSTAVDGGGAEGAALHLACPAEVAGHADPVGAHRPLQVRDLLELDAPIPSRVALVACASGGDYRFDEAAGLVAALVIGGAEVVTATLWSLPTAAGHRQAAPDPLSVTEDPMAELVIGVDEAHQGRDPGRAVNQWQRAQMRRWRDGDLTASPVHWAAIVTYRFGEGVGAVTAVDVRAALPRRAVIDRAWRQIGAGVEVLSSRDGGPLSRTVKRILDPLVFRLRANPDFSSPVVSAEVADAMGDELLDHADTLRACAAWFSVLKAQRRALRITAGNAQELYFTVCFELAVTRGAPATDGADVAASVLRDIHDGRDRHGIEVLDDLLDDQQALAKLDDQVERSWADVQPTNADVAGFFERLRAVHADASTRPERRARQQAWESLVAEDAPHELGVRVRRTTGVVPWTVSDLGLCAEAPQQRPPVVAAAGRPLDRGVVDRVRATLRRSRDRDDLPVVPMLCAEEADRACAPWGLMAEDLQATLVNGIVVAVQLKPLDPRTEPDTPFAATIQAKLRKEAYVLHARRLLADVTALHPRQRQVVDDLDAFARPYLGRLWARLHGRDVWQESCSDVEDVRSLLTGIARSVSLDHRQRIKAMLEPEAAA